MSEIPSPLNQTLEDAVAGFFEIESLQEYIKKSETNPKQLALGTKIKCEELLKNEIGDEQFSLVNKLADFHCGIFDTPEHETL